MIKDVPFKKHFLLGHTKYFAKSTLGFVTKCTDLNMPMAKAKIGFKGFVFLFEPDTITHVLQKNNKNYVKSFAYKGLKAFLGNGLLTAEQNLWLKNRRVLQPGFIQKEIRILNDDITDAIDYKVNLLDLSKTYNLQELFLDWTKDILLKSMFGLNVSEIKELGNMHTHLWFLRNYANSRMKKPFMPPLSWPTKTNKSFKIAVFELEGIILKLFKLSSNKPQKGKLVQHILEQQKEGKWDDQQVFDEIITLFLAGQETTTNAMVFLVHCLHEYPDYINRISDKNDPLAWEHIINEVLRLYPPVWAVSREALSHDKIDNKPIKKGTTLFLSIYAIQRHPKFWKQPNQFRPERFLEKFSKQAYMPFGIGPRMCIGNHLALLEMKLMAEKIYTNFEIENKSENPLQLITPMTLGTKSPYLVKLKNLILIKE